MLCFTEFGCQTQILLAWNASVLLTVSTLLHGECVLMKCNWSVCFQHETNPGGDDMPVSVVPAFGLIEGQKSVL